MSAKTLISPLSTTPPEPVTFTTEDAVYLSNHLDFNNRSLDVRRIVTFLFHNRGTFFSEARIRKESGYYLSQEIFIRDITAFEEQLSRAKNAPLRLMKKAINQDTYTYAIVSREFFLQAQKDQEVSREIKFVSKDTKLSVQKTTPPWNSQEWLDSVDYVPVSAPLRFAGSLSSVDAQIRSHCIYICLEKLAVHAGEWVTMIDLEDYIAASLRAIKLPPHYTWSDRFTLLELVREMQANFSVTKRNTFRISSQDSPRAYRLDTPATL